MDKNEVYKVLKELNIKYEIYEHEAVFTVEEAKKLNLNMNAGECKNLFLRNRKGSKHYLVVLREDKTVDLKDLQSQINSTPLSFASEERLYKYLKLKPGSVTPMGLINDKDNIVDLILDKDLANCNRISFHPNVNTETIVMDYNEFEKFIDFKGNKVIYVEI
ncbi:prolyl-tRNA synthetase associated domain-containing protein [Clostridium sp.]|uniref:prolyl-tRNA synthetase associated domain-containing protein n=1 Tax=Clostridium sp. TaxID=1506 RepID=UPI003463A769